MVPSPTVSLSVSKGQWPLAEMSGSESWNAPDVLKHPLTVLPPKHNLFSEVADPLPACSVLLRKVTYPGPVTFHTLGENYTKEHSNSQYP